jgi:ribosomal protein L7Ae-like RNA K-turn-binding protein
MNSHSEPIVLNENASWPSVSIIMPIDAKITAEKELKQSLKGVADKISREFREHYTEDKYHPVLARITTAIDELKPESGAKSVAIFASPGQTKTYFLDAPAEEKIVIDESFEIRNLLYSKATALKYLVLLISGEHAKAYMAEDNHFTKIKLKASDYPDVINTENTKERVLNFTDTSSVKETNHDKFLRKVDTELTELLHKENISVFLLGSDKTLGHFKNITANQDSIVAYIHGNYFESSIPELKQMLGPSLDAWRKKEMTAAIAKLEEAANQHRLAKGINEVWKAVQNRLGQLLVVERNFSHPQKGRSMAQKLQKTSTPGSNIFYTRDAVDEIIEQVVKYGGKVIFTDDNALASFGHIALVQYYQG